MAGLIEQRWQAMAKALFEGIDVGEVQLNEMRKAFYGGAASVLALVTAIGEDSVPEEEGCQILEALVREVQVFAHALPSNTAGMTQEEWKSRQH